MPLTIRNHRLDGIAYRATPNTSGKFKAPPSLLVVHDTAGRSAASSVDWLSGRAAKASAHLVIGRDGGVTQLAPFDTVTWHAGASTYRGKAMCNEFSIGIEFDNPGILDRAGKAWFGAVYEGTEPFTTPQHGSGRMLPYTEAQLSAGAEVIALLGQKYPSLADLQPHWFISPGRKFDTLPGFPLAMMRTILLGQGSAEAAPPRGPWGITITDVNLRRWPSSGDNIIRVVPADTEVDLIRSGTYASGFPAAQWHLCRIREGGEGWLHSDYVDERP